MFDATLQRIRKKLLQYEFFRRVVEVLERTPMHAVHWYALMAVGLVVTVVNVGLAWFVFTSVSVNSDGLLGKSVKAATINRAELQESLEVYRARTLELEQLKEVPSQIIDPGR